MRLIDADALFEKLFHAWGTEMDAGPANDFMQMINDAPTIIPPPNAPLTLEELREMDGEPVCVVIAGVGRYAVIEHCEKRSTKFTDGMEPPNDRYGIYWLAYRRRPEEGTV